MEFEKIIELSYQIFDSFAMQWIIYITISLGILTILVSFPKFMNSIVLRLLFIISFSLFSFTNFITLDKIAKDGYFLKQKACEVMNIEMVDCGILDKSCKEKELFKYQNDPYKSIAANMITLRGDQLWSFHVIQDIIVILLIWLIPSILVRLNPPKDILKKEISIANSKLPKPLVSYNKSNNIWILEKEIKLNNDSLIPFKDLSKELNYLEIEKGFEFDLASVPRMLWVFLAPFELSVIAPLIHDYLYQSKGRFIKQTNDVYKADLNGVQLVSRKEADELFFNHMRLENIGVLKSYLAYFVVRIFGSQYWPEK